MKTEHRILIGDARDLGEVADASVHAVVTSPPYPMIQMWDGLFCALNPAIEPALEADSMLAFELMHRELDRVWRECARVLVPGGLMCVNVGDATRTIGGQFRLFSNHTRITSAFGQLDFTPLPDVLWRKQTNAPNKFMGSGMLPAGAYVTYEHEYVLIARKGKLRTFRSDAEKRIRRQSAFFWEERNVWFSDVWTDLKGVSQELIDRATRDRSGAFPFELPYRLIQMHSVYGDTILDPFLGTGTTMLAGLTCARSTVGFEIDPDLRDVISLSTRSIVEDGNARIDERLSAHREFVRRREEAGRASRHRNEEYGFAVVTGQERNLVLLRPVGVEETSSGHFEATHAVERETVAVGKK